MKTNDIIQRLVKDDNTIYSTDLRKYSSNVIAFYGIILHAINSNLDSLEVTLINEKVQLLSELEFNKLSQNMIKHYDLLLQILEDSDHSKTSAALLIDNKNTIQNHLKLLSTKIDNKEISKKDQYLNLVNYKEYSILAKSINFSNLEEVHLLGLD